MTTDMTTDQHLEQLFEFLRIPTISALSQHDHDMKRACLWLKEAFEKIGFDSDILPTAGHPLVYAESMAAGEDKTTLLIYGHYDVQSPDPLEQWTSKPFEPEVRGNNIYCRGVADDKAQLYAWIAAVGEWVKSGKTLPVNIKFLIEGEEEVGGHNLETFIGQNQSLLKADICLISDSHCLSEDQPVIDYGLRGIVYAELDVRTFARDVHSGIYGGNVLNPIQVLAEMLAKLKNDDHLISIPGFYDHVRQLSDLEQQELDASPLSTEQVIAETGAKMVTGEKGYSVAARAGARPSLDVHGIWGGYQDDGAKTIIPAEAHAKVSMRIVPHQTSAEIAELFEKYIKRLTPEGVDVQVRFLSNGEPILMDRHTHFFKKAELAYQKAFGKTPIYELSGGSIPVTAMFKTLLNLDCILMGFGLPDDGLHSPNEKMSIAMFEKGITTCKEFIATFE